MYEFLAKMRRNLLILLLIVMALGMRWAGRLEAVDEIGVGASGVEKVVEASESGERKEEKENITEPKSEESKSRLEAVVEEQEVGKWNGLNTGRKVVRLAIERGATANTIVLLLLLPLVATLVSVVHYIFGLEGYGIFMPTMIAVTFLATGVFGGLLLFALILVVSLVCRMVLKKLRLHFLTSRAINLMFISLGTFGLMMLTTFADLVNVSQISIFPILFMILLAEEFVRAQLLKSKNEAERLMTGTLVLAIAGAWLMSIQRLQELVILYPDLVVLAVVVINIWLGNYKGMRLMEIERFKGAIREEGKRRGVKK